ncbi:MAG: hypothetical protein ACXVAS_07985 [Vulcanimicrobiaceae bacterium]
MRSSFRAAAFAVALTVASVQALALVPVPSRAQAVPTPAPSPSAAPGRGKVFWLLDGSNTFIDQNTSGPGTQPPEGPGFAKGSPLSPMTPYETFSSAPYTPGLAGVLQYVGTAVLDAPSLTATARIGAGLVTGSTTNASYWGENLLPAYNPHLGSTALPFRIVFPTGPGHDDGDAQRLSLLGASVGTSDGAYVLRGGYFDLAQTNRSVFIQAPLTSVTPEIGLQTAESLGDGPPTLGWWPAPEAGLPLLGADLIARRGSGTLELTDALLPALPGTAARMVGGSFAVSRSDARYAAQIVNVTTSGSLISTTTMFGADAHTVPGPQGELPASTLGNQRQTIVGLSGDFRVTKALDAQVDFGRAFYNAENVIEPGSQRPGGFYHLGLSYGVRRAAGTVEFFRFDPRYATTILPYGVPENVWSVAWSWPGQWLKSNYQLVDNTPIGANREGLRLRYRLLPGTGNFQLRASYAKYRQLDMSTLSNVNQTGFVDGFFLPQQDDAGTRGGAEQYALWGSLQGRFANVTIDYVNDLQHRPAVAAHPEDFVGYVAPAAVLTLWRALSPATLLAVGGGRYAMRGAWATTPVDFGQNVFFIGAQLVESKEGALLVQLRGSHFDGLPSFLNGPSPDFGNTLLVVEQRVRF